MPQEPLFVMSASRFGMVVIYQCLVQAINVSLITASLSCMFLWLGYHSIPTKVFLSSQHLLSLKHMLFYTQNKESWLPRRTSTLSTATFPF
jgi:hypothetical protein